MCVNNNIDTKRLKCHSCNNNFDTLVEDMNKLVLIKTLSNFHNFITPYIISNNQSKTMVNTKYHQLFLYPHHIIQFHY